VYKTKLSDQGLIESVKTADKGETTFEHDDKGVKTIVEPDGTTWERDANDTTRWKVTRKGSDTPVEWAGTIEVDKTGKITREEEGANEKIVDYPDGTREVTRQDGSGITYDINNNVTSFTDNFGNTTHYKYNEKNQPIEVRQPEGDRLVRGAGDKWEYVYADGTKDSISDVSIDEEGTLRYEDSDYKYELRTDGYWTTVDKEDGTVDLYDGKDRILESTTSKGTRSFDYDEKGLKTYTAPDGSQWQRSGDHEWTEYKKDSKGEYKPTGEIWKGTVELNSRDGLVWKSESPDGGTKEFTYNEQNELVEIKGLDGAIWEHTGPSSWECTKGPDQPGKDAAKPGDKWQGEVSVDGKGTIHYTPEKGQPWHLTRDGKRELEKAAPAPQKGEAKTLEKGESKAPEKGETKAPEKGATKA